MLLLLIFAVSSLAIGPYPIANISISGISSGGYFATQVQLAFSHSFIGAAIYAAGPYYCAQGEEWRGLSECMINDFFVDVDTLVQSAESFASSGDIDALSNLQNHNVYLFSGLVDVIVPQGLVKDLQTFYEDVGVPSANIQTEFSVTAAHTFPTDDYGNFCFVSESPYISNCEYDGAGNGLQQLHGSLKPKTQAVGKVVSFSQGPFVQGGDPSSISMGPNAYLYVPTACASASKNVTCKLHVSFHGCEQTVDDVQDAYYNHAGFNEWAESNNILVLYPQVQKSLLFPSNPQGCWDWWGYTGSDYAWQTGPQIAAVANMINALTGRNITSMY